MYTCKVVSNERLVFKESLELPAYVYTIVKHYHFTICYSKKIISAIACPDALFWLPQKAKNVKFSGASPLNPIGVLTAPPPPSCYKLATLPTGATLVLFASLTFQICRLLVLIRRCQCCTPEPLIICIYYPCFSCHILEKSLADRVSVAHTVKSVESGH